MSLNDIDKNVYIIGAGFSKELGLPLQDDFLLTAQEVYFKNPSKYVHFEKVIEYKDELSKIRNYLSMPLLNLESLFNLLEMHCFFSKLDKYDDLKNNFKQLIRDVLIEVTPKPIVYVKSGGGSSPELNPLYRKYLNFISLFINYQNNNFSTYNDTIISFNYDLIIESTISLFNFFYTESGRGTFQNALTLDVLFGKSNISFDSPSKYFESKENLSFLFHESFFNVNTSKLKLIKLHGSINWKISDDTFIVPPSWNKSDDRIRLLWERAYDELCNAKRIIIVGYSFPETDIYVKSLLALAINNNKKLKTIIFVNPDIHSTKERCLSFIDDHFKQYCEYKEWTFSKFMNKSISEKFIKERLNRSFV